MTDEQQALDGLVTHPGFLMVVAYARKRWKDDLPNRVKEAIEKARAERRDAAYAVDALWDAQSAVDDVLAFPKRRLLQLQEMEAASSASPDPSRRGGL